MYLKNMEKKGKRIGNYYERFLNMYCNDLLNFFIN